MGRKSEIDVYRAKGRPRRNPPPVVSEEERAHKTLKKMLAGHAPVDMLPHIRKVRTPLQKVTLPNTGRTVQIVRLAAEGVLTFGREEDKRGETWYVAGTADWGYLWRLDRSDWNYLRLISKEAKRSRKNVVSIAG